LPQIPSALSKEVVVDLEKIYHTPTPPNKEQSPIRKELSNYQPPTS